MTMDIFLSYKRKPQAEFSSFATTVGQRMSDDARFKSLAAEIADLVSKNVAFTAATSLALGGNDAQKANKKVCWDATLEAVDVLAYAVNALSKGDEQIIKAAGFEMKRDAKAINEVATPSNVKLKNSDRTGEISARWDGDPNAVNYGIYHRAEGETAFKNGTYATACSAVLTGLTPKTYYEICVQTLGRKGLKSALSEPTTVLVS